MKKLLIAIFLLVLVSCQSKLKPALTASYHNGKTALDLELTSKDKKNYYGSLKIANMSKNDLSFMISKKSIVLACGDNKKYQMYQYYGRLGINIPNPYFYLRRDKIRLEKFVVETSDDLSKYQTCSIEIDDSSYREVRVINQQKNNPLQKGVEMVDSLMKGIGKYVKEYSKDVTDYTKEAVSIIPYPKWNSKNSDNKE